LGKEVYDDGYMKSIEVLLGSWGRIECLNEQHRAYLIEAKKLSEIKQAVASWRGGWLSKGMEEEYRVVEEERKHKCDLLWEAIPDRTDDLSKSH